MKKATQRILSMMFAIAAAMALAVPAYAAEQRVIRIDHNYYDNDGNHEQREMIESVNTATPTQLSSLVYPVLGLSGGNYEYDVVNFHLEIYYADSTLDEVLDWTGAEVATTSWQFHDLTKVRVYEVVVEYGNPRPVTRPTTASPSYGGSSGSASDGEPGGSSYLGTIGVIGLPENPVETGSTVKLTTIPADTSVQYDEKGLALERLENGGYRFTILRDGTHSITFRRSGYHDRTVELTGRTTIRTDPAPLLEQDYNTYNPNTGAPRHLGLVWAALVLSGACIVGVKRHSRRGE